MLILDYTKIKVNVFEGDLTQTPHLIPTEYVEGIQSTLKINIYHIVYMMELN